MARGRFLALLALEHGPKHGYEISKYIAARTNGFFTISFGALYPVLHKLEKDGLVRANWHDVGVTKKKKTYALSRRGRAALSRDRDEYEAEAQAFRILLEAG